MDEIENRVKLVVPSASASVSGAHHKWPEYSDIFHVHITFGGRNDG